MLKLFRKIRQKLLSENKFSKYLLYALGEIVLVVIGILIALQINNWNEERKALRTQKNLLTSFYENLGADSLTLFQNRQKIMTIIETQKQIQRARKGLIAPLEIGSPQIIRGSIRNFSVTRANHPDIATKVFNEELKEEIREYYRLLAFLDNAYTQYDNVVKQIVRPYLAENNILNPDFLFDNQDVFDSPHLSSSLFHLDRFYGVINKDDFSQLLFESNLKANELIDYFNDILDANAELRNSIKIDIQRIEK